MGAVIERRRSVDCRGRGEGVHRARSRPRGEKRERRKEPREWHGGRKEMPKAEGARFRGAEESIEK